MKSYKTVAGPGTAEQIIEKSRFICHVAPASSKEEADNFIADIRKQYKDATHNVPAMIIGQSMEIQWGSDDGEPQGTSGAPVVHMLVEEEITDVVVVITRYFGGIKLGTGGLVRAYTSSARLGIEAAGLCRIEPRLVLECTTDYRSFNRITSASIERLDRIEDVEYGEKVSFRALCTPENSRALTESLTSLTNGDIEIKEAGEIPAKVGS